MQNNPYADFANLDIAGIDNTARQIARQIVDEAYEDYEDVGAERRRRGRGFSGLLGGSGGLFGGSGGRQGRQGRQGRPPSTRPAQRPSRPGRPAQPMPVASEDGWIDVSEYEAVLDDIYRLKEKISEEASELKIANLKRQAEEEVTTALAGQLKATVLNRFGKGTAGLAASSPEAFETIREVRESLTWRTVLSFSQLITNGQSATVTTEPQRFCMGLQIVVEPTIAASFKLTAIEVSSNNQLITSDLSARGTFFPPNQRPPDGKNIETTWCQANSKFSLRFQNVGLTPATVEALYYVVASAVDPATVPGLSAMARKA